MMQMQDLCCTVVVHSAVVTLWDSPWAQWIFFDIFIFLSGALTFPDIEHWIFTITHLFLRCYYRNCFSSDHYFPCRALRRGVVPIPRYTPGRMARRALFECLGFRYLAQGDLSSALKESWYLSCQNFHLGKHYRSRVCESGTYMVNVHAPPWKSHQIMFTENLILIFQLPGSVQPWVWSQKFRLMFSTFPLQLQIKYHFKNTVELTFNIRSHWLNPDILFCERCAHPWVCQELVIIGWLLLKMPQLFSNYPLWHCNVCILLCNFIS